MCVCVCVCVCVREREGEGGGGYGMGDRRTDRQTDGDEDCLSSLGRISALQVCMLAATSVLLSPPKQPQQPVIISCPAITCSHDECVSLTHTHTVNTPGLTLRLFLDTSN